MENNCLVRGGIERQEKLQTICQEKRVLEKASSLKREKGRRGSQKKAFCMYLSLRISIWNSFHYTR